MHIFRKYKAMKINIIGHARHGKDTLAELLNEYYGISYKSSSEMANELFIFDKLKDRYGYETTGQCFEDRVNHRSEWYLMICDYNREDKARLAKDIIANHDCYVGMRDLEEFKGSRELFDLIIWVDASERLSTERHSFNIDKNQADLIIQNNGGLDEFRRKVRRIFDGIFLTK